VLHLLDRLAAFWLLKKDWIVQHIPLSDDALHVHGSLMIFMLSAIIIRKRPDNIWSWLIILAFETFNEYADMRGQTPGEADIAASLHDIYNTMFWPTVILLFGRLLFPRRLPVILPTPSSDLADQPFEQAPTA
jgi:hypothetical protein